MAKHTLTIALVASGILGAGCLSEPPSEATDTADINSHHAVTQHNLISDLKGFARHTDPNLVNPWGVALDEDHNFWIANNGTGKIGIVDRNGNPGKGEYRNNQFDLGDTGIDGIVRNESAALEFDFMVASESGQLFGINGDDNPKSGILFADRTTDHAIFKGIAIVGDQVVATDFHNARVDVFDAKGHLVTCSSFVDPAMMKGFAPFNIVAIDDKVYVTYAKQDDAAEDDVAGPGLGAISVFDTSGKFLARVATGGVLDAPWAVLQIGSQLTVGNFGDGRISLFDATSYKPRGQVIDGKGKPVSIDGLWGLVSGGGKTLYFAAGINDEADGLFGFLAL